MRSFLTLSIASLLLSVFGTATAAANPGEAADASSGSITIALLDVASELADDPRANVYITDNVPPGRTITHHVRVTNRTGADAVLDVYAGPAKIVDGTFTPQDRGDTNPLTSWIGLDKNGLALADGQSEDVAVTITVPEDAPEVEQYGVIWASTQPKADTDGVQVVSRVGVRVYLSVGAGNGPPSDFAIANLIPQRDADGNATIVAEVHNNGGRAVDLNGSLDLANGPGGLTARTVPAQTVTVGPGGTGEVAFVVPKSATLPAGPWEAAVKLESGFNRHDSAASITFPDRGVGESVGASNSGWPIAAWIALVTAVLLAVSAIGLYVVRHRRRTTGADPSTPELSESVR